jgi:hypothetical protein
MNFFVKQLDLKGPKENRQWNCRCGKVHSVSVYLAAHWREEMIFTCECGNKFNLLCGQVTVESENEE